MKPIALYRKGETLTIEEIPEGFLVCHYLDGNLRMTEECITLDEFMDFVKTRHAKLAKKNGVNLAGHRLRKRPLKLHQPIPPQHR